MKNKYVISEQSRIVEEPPSRQETIHVRQNSQDASPLYQSQQHQQKLRISEELFNKQPEDWNELIKRWPEAEVKKLVMKHGVQLFKNKTVFVGHRINGMIHGFGLMISGPQTFYEGNFQNNVKHGYGCQATEKGIYVGHYINGKPEGKGIYYSNNGEQYEGQFVAGMKHGYGKWSTSTQLYTGEWRTNKPDGTGTIKNELSQYEGQIRRGIKHGYGKERFKNGDSYVGNYINGRPEGFGQYKWQSGAFFQGNFKNGLRHGKGVWVSQGDRYEGEYANDKKCGFGSFTWHNGDRYLGEYFNDLKHGQGQMKWSDGSWYRGGWRYGVQNGQGELYETGGNIRRGLFESNVMVEESIELKRSKLDRSFATKKDTSRKTQPDAATHRKLPNIHTEKNRRHTASLVTTKLPKGISNPYHVRTNAEAYSINRSLQRITQAKRRSKSFHNSNRTQQVKLAADSTAFDVIQWSNIYNFQTQPIQRGNL